MRDQTLRKEVTVEQEKPPASSIMLTDKKKTSPRLATTGKPKKVDQWNRILIDMSSEAMLVCDMTYQIIAWNHGAESMYGWSAQEAEGQVSEMLLKACIPYYDTDIRQTLLQTGHWEGQVHYTHRDGRIVHVLSQRKLMRDEHDQPSAILEVHRVISAQPVLNRALQTANSVPIHYNNASKHIQLQASKARFQKLFVDTTTIVGLTITDEHNHFLEVNDAFLTILGYTRADLEKHQLNWQLITPEEYHGRDQEALEEVLATGVCKPYEKELFNRAGARIPILVAGAIDTTSRSIIMLVVDMTIQKEEEKQREAFLNIVGHELRTPLTAMSGSIQLARRRLQTFQRSTSLLSSDVQAFLIKLDSLLEQSLRQTRVQDRLINDLLDISRLAVDKLELTLQSCDLVSIIRETIEDLRFTGTRHEILLTPPTQPIIPVLADPERVGQIMANYLTNAQKYSPPSTPITVEITLDTDMAYVWVHDKGVGLSLDEQKHIWDRYYRVSDASIYQNNGVNLGLGLYICRMLIKRLKGQVGVKSTLGEGSSFWFSLPLVKKKTDAHLSALLL